MRGLTANIFITAVAAMAAAVPGAALAHAGHGGTLFHGHGWEYALLALALGAAAYWAIKR